MCQYLNIDVQNLMYLIIKNSIENGFFKLEYLLIKVYQADLFWIFCERNITK